MSGLLSLRPIIYYEFIIIAVKVTVESYNVATRTVSPRVVMTAHNSQRGKASNAILLIYSHGVRRGVLNTCLQLQKKIMYRNFND